MTARTTLFLIAASACLVACSTPEGPDTLELGRSVSQSAQPPDNTEPDEVGSEDQTETNDASLADSAAEPAALELEPTESDAPSVPLVAYELRHGESLDHFARWSGLPVEDIAAASDLSLNGAYMAGTRVKMPLGEDARSALEKSRDAHHIRRAEGYLNSRGGSVGTEFITVRTGDTAWSLAREQQGIPIWLLETYNPSTNLDALRPGQQLMVPVVADIVVDAEDLDTE